RKNTFIIPQKENTWVMEPWGTYHSEYDPDKEGTHKYDLTDALAKTWSVQPCRKFDDATNPQYYSKSFRDVHLITLPEMFHVAAEAYLKAENPTNALARLNETRVRAGIAPETTVTIDKILEESARESFGNGHRRMDLRRTQKLVEYNNLYNVYLKGTAASAIGQQLLWPIPQAAIDANAAMTEADQNPGY
ncbi:MAG: RagB/SusD family nutrient uptake outer membrane protein, partial [Alistipes sp.]|nr:RagB/SusD family nutrient uptake outer membrane protein [Alistipes sp.]